MRLDDAASDRIAVTSGTLTYGGTLAVSILNPPTALVQTYTLFTGTTAGSFTSVSLPAAPTGYHWHDYGSGTYFSSGQVRLDADELVLTLSTPVDAGRTLNPRAALVWYVPYASAGSIDFLVTVDGAQVADSAAASTGFEYHNGTAWASWSGAVPPAPAPGNTGRRVRWRPPADLSTAAHTWRIRAKIGAVTGALSAQRSLTVAAAPWGADLAPGDAIRAAEITQLRAEADLARACRGLGAVTWSEAITVRVTPIRKSHLEELRTALAPVFAEAGYVQHAGRPATIDPGSEAAFYGEALVQYVTPIKTQHFQRIRDALKGF
jgi:hypothetical protein